MSKTEIPAVRIVPMDSRLEFRGQSVQDVQQTFFLKNLLNVDRPPGKFRYRQLGLKAEPGATVLFQYDGRLIASATLLEVERFKVPEEGTYRGALYFDPKLVRVFDPVGPDVVRRIWPKFKGFSHTK